MISEGSRDTEDWSNDAEQNKRAITFFHAITEAKLSFKKRTKYLNIF